MSDLKLVTKRTLGTPDYPPQPGNPNEYFGEQSNDIQLDTVNDFDLVSGTIKLTQDINKILLTAVGTNTNFPLYGTTLQDLIGSKNSFEFLQATIKDQIIGALQVLAYVNQNNTNEDEIPNILNILEINQLTSDTIEIILAVTTLSGKSVSTGLTVAVTA